MNRSQYSLQSRQCHQSRDSQVWDPGARILIYSENNNNNSIINNNSNRSNNNEANTKDKNKASTKQNKIINTRASPNKSQDSGFSDSGESESSSNNSEHNKVQGHVTKVYFYSNNAESHYQSPSSLPVYSTVTQIQTGSRSQNHTHSVSIPDVGKLSNLPLYNNHRNNHKKELKNVVLVQGDSKNHNIVSSVTVDGSYHPSKMRIFNKTNRCNNKEKLE